MQNGAVEIDSLKQRFLKTRELTENIVAPLENEDLVIQSMPDVSPPKWHLGHTTWFFEYLVLLPYLEEYTPFFSEGSRLFNSYYEVLGSRVARPSRGLLSRPTVRDIHNYRASVTEKIVTFLDRAEQRGEPQILERIEIGIHHEQQHQELLLTDIKHILWQNFPAPAYVTKPPSESPPGLAAAREMSFIPFEGGLREFGADGEGLSYDNEGPRHRFYLEAFELADRLVTNQEFLEFINDGGYRDYRYWLSDGWDALRGQGWQAPPYWENRDGQLCQYTLRGMEPLDLHAPVTHVSFYEASAFAKWRKCRLPSEYEWELAALSTPRAEMENFLDTGRLHPTGASPKHGMQQLFGDCWEWTSSAYLPYPGFESMRGELEEYNGKFMNDQRVLRGGSCVTPGDHIRATYRNFFQGDKRWQFSGIRLAR